VKPCKAHSDAFGKIKKTHKRTLLHAATVVFSRTWLAISVFAASLFANSSIGSVISDDWLKSCACAIAVGVSHVLLQVRAGELLRVHVICSKAAGRVVGVL